MKNQSIDPLNAEQCTARIDANQIPETQPEDLSKAQLAPQRRAVEALKRGLSERAPGFNVAVVGRRGTGRTFIALDLAREEAKLRNPPHDLILLPNPRWPLEPVPTFLPAGSGPVFVRAMEELHARLTAAIHEVLESRISKRLQVEVHREHSAAEQVIQENLANLAAEHGLALVASDEGFDFVPIDEEQDRQAKKPELGKRTSKHPRSHTNDLNSKGTSEYLPESASRSTSTQVESSGADEVEQDNLETHIRHQHLAAIEKLRPHIEEAHRQIALQEAESGARLVQRQREALAKAFNDCFSVIPQRDVSSEPLQTFMQQLHKYLFEIFHLEEGQSLPLPNISLPSGLVVPTLLTTSLKTDAAPIVHGQNVTLSGLFGRVVTGSNESRYPEPGTILAGDLHRANGGFLVLDAEALVKREQVYEHLKRCLLASAIQPYEGEGESSAVRIHPIDLDVKVVLVADSDLITQLQELDPEFSRLFKIRADFSDDMSLDEAFHVYPSVAAWQTKIRGIPPCSRAALAQLLVYGTRLAGDQQRFSANLGLLSDLLTEATAVMHTSASAQPESQQKRIEEQHIQDALKIIHSRQGQLRDHFLQMYRDKTLRIVLEGAVVGQINGLTVVSDGFHAIGRPCRVTAVTYAGNDGPFNIEREVEMAGPIHNKGMLILNGYLNNLFAGDYPINFGASVVFEQTYSPIEGDSASAAELFAILSSLARIPIRQDIGVTGSIDQLGRMLPVGGINEKVEGFFDLCQDQRLSGTQGVMIPQHNVRNLILREDLIAAIVAKQFFVWPIATVEQGVELLFGKDADTLSASKEALPSGHTRKFTPQTVYGQIEIRLNELRKNQHSTDKR